MLTQETGKNNNPTAATTAAVAAAMSTTPVLIQRESHQTLFSSWVKGLLNQGCGHFPATAHPPEAHPSQLEI